MQTDTQEVGQSTDALIGERVHQLMWRSRLSQVAFAGAIGVTQSAISKKLRGERPWFAEELVSAASVLGVSIGYLFGEGDPTRPDLQQKD